MSRPSLLSCSLSGVDFSLQNRTLTSFSSVMRVPCILVNSPVGTVTKIEGGNERSHLLQHDPEASGKSGDSTGVCHSLVCSALVVRVGGVENSLVVWKRKVRADRRPRVSWSARAVAHTVTYPEKGAIIVLYDPRLDLRREVKVYCTVRNRLVPIGAVLVAYRSRTIR